MKAPKEMTQTTGLAARLAVALVDECDVLKSDDSDTQCEIVRTVEQCLFGEFLAMALQLAEDTKRFGLASPEAENVYLTAENDALRAECLRLQGGQAAELDRQAAMHEAELDRRVKAHEADCQAARTTIDTLRADVHIAVSNAQALLRFAENHRKFVSAWGSVRRYLGEHDDRALVLTIDHADWYMQMHRVASGTDQSVDVALHEEHRFDYQDAPCPRLLADWCENEMRKESK